MHTYINEQAAARHTLLSMFCSCDAFFSCSFIDLLARVAANKPPNDLYSHSIAPTATQIQARISSQSNSMTKSIYQCDDTALNTQPVNLPLLRTLCTFFACNSYHSHSDAGDYKAKLRASPCRTCYKNSSSSNWIFPRTLLAGRCLQSFIFDFKAIIDDEDVL